MNALTPARYAVDLGFRIIRQVLPGRPRCAAEADRAQESILRNRRLAEDFGQPAVADAPLKFHLPEAILRVHVTEPVKRVGLGFRNDVGDRVGVAHDLDRRGDPGDRDVAARDRQRLAQVNVVAAGQCEDGDSSTEPPESGPERLMRHMRES